MVLSSKEKRLYSYFTIIPEAFRKGQEKSHTAKEIPWWCGEIIVEGNAQRNILYFYQVLPVNILQFFVVKHFALFCPFVIDVSTINISVEFVNCK